MPPETYEPGGDNDPWDEINRGEWPGSEWVKWAEKQMVDLTGLRADQLNLDSTWRETLKREWMRFRTTSVSGVWLESLDAFFRDSPYTRSDIVPEEIINDREALGLMRSQIDFRAGLNETDPLENIELKMEESQREFSDDILRILEVHGHQIDPEGYSWLAIPAPGYEPEEPVLVLVEEIEGVKRIEIDDPAVLEEARRLLVEEYPKYLKLLFSRYLIKMVNEHIRNLENFLLRGALEKVYKYSQNMFFQKLVAQTNMGAVELEVIEKREEGALTTTYRIESLYSPQGSPVLQFEWQEQEYGNRNPKNIVFIKMREDGAFEYGLLQENAIQWWDGNGVLNTEFSPNEIKKMSKIMQVIKNVKPFTENEFFSLYEKEARKDIIDDLRTMEDLSELLSLVNGAKMGSDTYDLRLPQWSPN